MREIDFRIVFGADGRLIFWAAAAWTLGAFAVFRFSRAPLAVKILRILSCFLILFLFASPSLVKTGKIFRGFSVIFLAEDSPSMNSKVRPGSDESKADAVLKWFRENAGSENGVSLGAFAFSPSGKCSPKYAGAGFDCMKAADAGGAAEKAALAFPGSGRIIVFTDGNSPGTQRLPPSLAEAEIVIAAVGDNPGDEWGRINSVAAPSFAFMRMPFEIEAETSARGFEKKELRLKILGIGGKEIASRSRGRGETAKTAVEVKPQRVGKNVFSACLSAGAGCLDEKKIEVEILREKTRIMYLCGRPGFEYSFLRRFLRNHRSVELVSFNILRDAQDVVNVPDEDLALIPFPVNEIFMKDINLFDVFVLHNFDFRRFAVNSAYLASLERFVSGGGGLLIIGGDRAFGNARYASLPILNAMLPVSVSNGDDFREASVKPLFSSHPVNEALFYPDLKGKYAPRVPLLGGVNVFAALKKGARAILEYETADGIKPLFAEKKYGKGKVAALGVDGLWKWKIKEGLYPEIGGLYDGFWEAVMNYLSGMSEIERFALNVSGETGSRPVFRLRVLNELYHPLREAGGLEITAWDSAGGQRKKLDFMFSGNGIFEANAPLPFGGTHMVEAAVKKGGRTLKKISRRFKIEKPEKRFIPPDVAALKKLAKELNAVYIPLGELKREDTFAGERAGEAMEKVLQKRVLRNSFAFFVIICFLMITEWALTRMAGYF